MIKEENLPDEWRIVELGNISREKITDGVHKTPKYREFGVPFITAKDINKGDINFSNCKYISHDEHKELIKRCKPEIGDILLSKVGTLGLVAKIETELEFSIFVQLALIKPKLDLICPDFLKFLLNSSYMQRQIQAKSNLSTMGYIGIGKISKLEIPLPPLKTQQKIVEILEKAEKLKEWRAEADVLTDEYLKSVFLEMFGDSVKFQITVK